MRGGNQRSEGRGQKSEVKIKLIDSSLGTELTSHPSALDVSSLTTDFWRPTSDL